VDAKRDLVAAVQTLLGLGVKHVLIMPVLEVSLTPYGRTLNPAFDANATNTFNDGILASLSAAFGGQTPNKVIYANTTGLTVIFRTATSLALAYGQFTDTGYGGTNPACGHSSIAVGNWTGCASTFNANYTTMLFADGIHLTPAGNQWVSQYLYNATASGWR
jgi:phospholipase/lecithinase/hemolysin